MYEVLFMFGFYALLVLGIFVLKWVFAAATILTGDKDALHDFGNLCSSEPPPRRPYRYQDKDEAYAEWQKWKTFYNEPKRPGPPEKYN